MTSGHILFIPGALLIGMFIGFILGTRAARNQFDLQRKRDAEREAVRAARAAKKAAGGGDSKAADAKAEKSDAKSATTDAKPEPKSEAKSAATDA